MEVRLVRRAIAEERNRDLALTLRRDPGAGGGGDAAADDAEAADEAVRQVDHVHGPRAPAADPGHPTEHLGRERFGVRSLRERVPVAAVGASHVVVGLERRADPDGNGLLARGQVRGAVHLPLEEQALDVLLEAADEPHAAVAIEVLRGRLAGLIAPVARAFGLRPGHASPLYRNRLQGLRA